MQPKQQPKRCCPRQRLNDVTSLTRQTGILPSQTIEALAAAGHIATPQPFAVGQVQPASLDLRLGLRVFRVRASFLPGRDSTVAERLKSLSLFEIDLSKGAVLETGAVYVAEILESVTLPDWMAAAANPKSSTGRLDVFTRVITDHSREFDQIAQGYKGPLYLEISPRTFPVLVRTGSRLSQLRFRAGAVRLDDQELRALHMSEKLVTSSEPSIESSGVAVSVDLAGFNGEGLIAIPVWSMSIVWEHARPPISGIPCMSVRGAN